MKKQLSKFITIVLLSAIAAMPVVLGQQPQEAKDSPLPLKDLKGKLAPGKSAKELVDSLKSLESLADEMHGIGLGGDLQRMLTHRDPTVRRQAAKAMGAIGVRSENPSPRVMLLSIAANDRDPEVCVAALQALGQFGPLAKSATPKFVEAMKHEDVRVRRAACGIFFHFQESDEKLIPLAIAALDDPDPVIDAKTPGPMAVSMLAMLYLRGYCKTPAKEPAPKLIAIAKSDKGTENYRYNALLTLTRVAPAESLPLDVAREWLKKTDSRQHMHKACTLISELGPRAKDAIPELVAALKAKPASDPLTEQSIKLGIVGAFRKLGPAAKEALPALEALANTGDVTLRRRVLEAIDAMRAQE
jgi:hypothetical protein